MLDQEELRRRLRAGRALAGLKTIPDLAARIDPDARMGERTLRKLEYGESALREPALRTIAAALGLPYSWFTVPSIAELLPREEFGADANVTPIRKTA